jgi:hypothetical protein
MGLHLLLKKKNAANASTMTATTTTTAPNATTMTTMTTTTTALDGKTMMTTATTNATAMAANDDWLRCVDGTAQRSFAAKIMAKMRRMKPALDQILKAGNVFKQAAMLCAVIDHHDLAAACEVAGINSPKDIATAKFVCEQSARMLGRAWSNKKAHGKTSRKKGDAVEVVLTFTAPLPNQSEDVPSRRQRACLLRIVPSTLDRVDGTMIIKRQQLTDRERGVH